jgi:hypothetical protein
MLNWLVRTRFQRNVATVGALSVGCFHAVGAGAAAPLPESQVALTIGGVGTIAGQASVIYSDQYSSSGAKAVLTPLSYVEARTRMELNFDDPAIYDYRDGNWIDEAFSQLQYSFVITSPSVSAADLFASQRPAVFATGNYQIFVEGVYAIGNDAFGSVEFQDFYSPSGLTEMCYTIDDCFERSGVFQESVGYYRLNALQFAGRIQLRAWSSVSHFGDGPATSAYAYIDPVISIDTTFLDQNPGFSVTQIALAVPEPTSWAMMIVGFGVVGATMRKRRAVPATG